jgi:hypothetical protein
LAAAACLFLASASFFDGPLLVSCLGEALVIDGSALRIAERVTRVVYLLHQQLVRSLAAAGVKAL